MAVIGKIQKNSLLLLIVIGLAMLAFIFTDFLRGGSGDIEQTPTATLNGEPINQGEYFDLKEAYVNQAENEARYQGNELGDIERRKAEDNAFNEYVRKEVLDEEFEKLGIVCTSDELNDMIHGKHVHPWILQFSIFNGPNGFSKDSVKKFISMLETEPAGADNDARNNWIQQRESWSEREKQLKEARKADKYVTLINKGVFVNKLEAENQHHGLYDKKEVSFVLQRYKSIPVDEVAITDEDIKNFYEEHKNDLAYEQQEARDLRMVFFPVAATEEDIVNLEGNLIELKKSFTSSQNPLGFIYQNSDSNFLSDSTVFAMASGDKLIYSPNSVSGNYPETIDDEIQASEIGDIVGPFMAYNSDLKREEIGIARVLDLPTQKQAWVRHILISSGAKRTEQEAKAIADSVMRVIRANDNFVEMVTTMSEDPGSIANNGEYKWFKEGMMVPTFNDASFNGAIGQLQLVKTSYGYHIVEVLGRADRKTPVLALVTKIIIPSDATLRSIESIAYDYILEVSNLEEDSAFSIVANEHALGVQSTRVYLSDDFILGIEDSDPMLGYAFSEITGEGTLSAPLLDKDKYVVAIVDNKIEAGTPEFEDVKEYMRIPTLQDKQAEVYIEKMSGKSSLEEIGPSLTQGVNQTVEVTFLGNSVYAGGQAEPEIMGELFTNIPVGQMTKPMKGKEGVYVFFVKAELPADETTDYSLVATPLKVKRVQTSNSRAIQALRERANLVDNRRKIEFQ